MITRYKVLARWTSNLTALAGSLIALALVVRKLGAVITRWLPQLESGEPKRPSKPLCLESGVSKRLELFEREFGAGMVIEVIDSFIPDTAQRLLELRHLIEGSDFTNLAREAHALKGSYGNMGAVSMQELCIRLERQGRSGLTHDLVASVGQLEQDFLTLRPALEAHRNALGQLIT